MGPNLRPLHKGNRRTASCWMSWSPPVRYQLPFLLWSRSMAETVRKATQPYSYPGDAMVNGSNGNLIYVSIQYRLGLFGFLGGRDIVQNGRPERRTARSKGRARLGATQHPTFLR